MNSIEKMSSIQLLIIRFFRVIVDVVLVVDVVVDVVVVVVLVVDVVVVAVVKSDPEICYH